MNYRIRSLKPEYFRDEKVQRLSRDARLLFIGLICHADDEGRLNGDVLSIRALVFPRDELPAKKVRTLLAAVRDIGLIHIYEAGGFDWVEIRGWAKHQRIDKPKPSQIPSHDLAFDLVSLASGNLVVDR